MTDQRDRDEASEQTELAGELERLFEKAVKDAPTPWEVDTLKSEGEYGSGPDTSTGFEVSAVYDGSGRVLFDALNSDAIMVQEDYPDEDGYVLAYDLVSDATAKLVVALVNNLPTILASLRRPTEAASAGAGDPPREPTEAMLNAARDWSYGKYGKHIGNDAAVGCWQAMFDAAESAGCWPNRT